MIGYPIGSILGKEITYTEKNLSRDGRIAVIANPVLNGRWGVAGLRGLTITPCLVNSSIDVNQTVNGSILSGGSVLGGESILGRESVLGSSSGGGGGGGRCGNIGGGSNSGGGSSGGGDSGSGGDSSGGSEIIHHSVDSKKIIMSGGRTARRGLWEQQRLTVIPPIVTLVVAVIGRRRHGQQHGVMIRRTLQLPASSCGVGTGQEETRGPQYMGISTQ